MTTLESCLKWHGGKSPLAEWIVRDNFPPQGSYLHFVDGCFGGGSILLAADHRGVSEVANDVHGDLANFWRVLADAGDAGDFGKLVRILDAKEFGKPAWLLARELLDSGDGTAAERAAAFFIVCRQSMAGRMKDFTPLSRTRTRGTKDPRIVGKLNEQVAGWLSAIHRLPAIHARLRRVVVLSEPVVDVIRSQDGPGTFYYLDPPYIAHARTAKSVYASEMSYDGHCELLRALGKLQGKFLLSGYPSPLYDGFARRYGWRRVTREVANHAAGSGGGKAKRKMTEVLWMNY